MENKIHHSAIIDDTVKLGHGNEIGPYCVLTGNIDLGNNNKLLSHVIMHGNGLLKIGNNNQFFPFVSLNIPQDKKYKGELSELHIGDHNVFREYSTANSGTKDGSMKTTIGNHGLFLMSSHVAHDCVVGDHVIFSNSVAIAGHVTVGDYAVIGGLSAVHQYTRIGEHAMIGGLSAVAGDVIPYGMVVGDRAYLAGLNIVGLRRRGFTKEQMHTLRSVYESVFAVSSESNFADRIKTAKDEFGSYEAAARMIEFIFENIEASRSLCKPR